MGDNNDETEDLHPFETIRFMDKAAILNMWTVREQFVSRPAADKTCKSCKFLLF